MRRCLFLLLVLLLAGCNGGTEGTRGNVGDNSPGSLPEPLTLALESQEDGQNMRVVLSADSASDLYQIAGSVSFDQTRYELIGVEAGGGLGNPQESFFTHGRSESGVDFAYTRRFSGRGAEGDLKLLHLIVRPLDDFRLSDFSLVRSPGSLVARDSLRRDLALLGDGEVH